MDLICIPIKSASSISTPTRPRPTLALALIFAVAAAADFQLRRSFAKTPFKDTSQKPWAAAFRYARNGHGCDNLIQTLWGAKRFGADDITQVSAVITSIQLVVTHGRIGDTTLCLATCGNRNGLPCRRYNRLCFNRWRGVPLLKNLAESQSANSVSVVGDGLDWRVRIFENGVEHLAFFTIEQHARSYASGQRLRMGISLVSPEQERQF